MNATASLASAKLNNDELLDLLGASLPEAYLDRRVEARHPFFAPVTLSQLHTPNKQLSAFSRELSCGGIGLLHNMPIERGDVGTVSVAIGNERVIKTAEAMWCKVAGDGWYLSGWRFVSVE